MLFAHVQTQSKTLRRRDDRGTPAGSISTTAGRGGLRYGNCGVTVVAVGTGNGKPSIGNLPLTRSCAWQFATQVVAGGATSTASSPITIPIRPPLATRHVERPPNWLSRAATCGLSLPTNFAEKPLAKLMRGLTGTG